MLLIAQALGADPDLVAIDDYESLAESLAAFRRRQSSKRASSPYEVKFKIWTGAEQAQKMQKVGMSSALSNFTKVLAQIAPQAQFIGAGTTDVVSRLPGEKWEEVSGVFTLLACPKGHLIVNTTIDTQMCRECEIDTYTLGMDLGCADGLCASRPCSTCPVGVECGLSPSSPDPFWQFPPTPSTPLLCKLCRGILALLPPISNLCVACIMQVFWCMHTHSHP